MNTSEKCEATRLPAIADERAENENRNSPREKQNSGAALAISSLVTPHEINELTAEERRMTKHDRKLLGAGPVTSLIARLVGCLTAPVVASWVPGRFIRVFVGWLYLLKLFITAPEL